MNIILLRADRRNGSLHCVLFAQLIDNRLTLTRIDYNEWEYNRRNGQVEITYNFTAETTAKIARKIGVSTTKHFLRTLKTLFRENRTAFGMMSAIEKWCKENDFAFDYSVWY